MAGRTPIGSSPPEVEIKVHPGRSEPHHHHHPARRPHHPPPQQPYSPFKKWVPWLSPTIVVTDVVLFVISMYFNDCPRNSSKCLGARVLGRFAFQSLRENPLLGPASSTLLRMGALDVTKVVDEHQAWRLFTCMWLHAGVFHILANMFSLIFVGLRLEQEFGFVRLGLLFVISGMGGSVLSSLFVRTTISVGASGALFGLLGGMLSELLTNWTIYTNKLRSLLTLILIIVINLAVGILPHVDNFAHLGGFVSGFLLGFVLLIHPHFGWVSQRNSPGYIRASSRSKYLLYQYVLAVISVVLLICGFTVGLILLLRGVNGNEQCSWCHYLTCIPTPLWNCDMRCRSEQYENQLNLTCLSNGNSGFYVLPNGNNTHEIQHLCYKLCS
ncbi:hypothetical protein LguiB_031178 [Lonicera macranthoides]